MDKKTGVYLSNLVALGGSFFILVLAFAAGFFAKAYYTGNSRVVAPTGSAVGTQQVEKTASLDEIKDVFNKSVIKFGDTKSKVVILEASDPSCPYCSIASGKNSDLNNQIGDRFKLVKDGGTYEAPVDEIRKLVDAGKVSYALIYRNGHGNGEMGMKAFYCAFEAGKFWPVHDLIMGGTGYNLLNETIKNDKSKSGELASFLSSAIDQNQMKTCLDSGKYDSKIQEESSLGDSIGLGGTPAFYVNDKSFAGAYSFTDMRADVESFLK